MRTYRFYKENEKWFIELPKFPFNKAWLEMVLGADLLLDKISDGKKEITLGISGRSFMNWDNVVERKQYLGIMKGALYSPVYKHIETKEFDSKNLLWLCPVTLWVFLWYPKKIYYKVISK